MSIDDTPAVGHPNGVHQSVALEVVIDQGRDDTGLGQTKPDNNVLRTVDHKKGNAVTLAVARRNEEVGYLVAPVFYLYNNSVIL